MKIGIFSRFEMPGGSEFRCAELANGITRYTKHEAFLLSEGDIPQRVLEKADKTVPIRTNVLKYQRNVSILYDMDAIVVVNSNSKLFTDVEYWRGNTNRHNSVVNLSKIKAFIFLFNYILYPVIRLTSLLEEVNNIKIVTANNLFFSAISFLDAYKEIRHLPRLMLESPIDPTSVSTQKTWSDKVRIGQYSPPIKRKFNEEIGELVTRINSRYYDNVSWDFMGIPESQARLIAQHPNVTVRKAFAMPINDFLKGIDIFLFYRSREGREQWSRAVAEALTSGCPVVATDVEGGIRDQIIHGSNGYLCRNLDDFMQYLIRLIESSELVRALGKDAVLYSRFFSTEYVVRKFMTFVR